MPTIQISLRFGQKNAGTLETFDRIATSFGLSRPDTLTLLIDRLRDVNPSMDTPFQKNILL